MAKPDAPSFDTFDVRAQEEARTAAEEKAKLATRVEGEDFKHVMRDKRGRRHVYRHMERAGIWRSSFHTNALQMAFNEGNRNEGLAMLAKLTEHCPDLYNLMLKEHAEDE